MIGSDYKQRIMVGEHIINLPALTKNKSEVLFVDNKPEDAYWRRITDKESFPDLWFDFVPYLTKLNQVATIYNQDGVLISLNEEDTKIINRVYVREMHRRLYGVFMKNKSDIIHLTGDHYFSLQHMKMYGVEGEYGSFWKFQAEIMYIIRHCWLSPDILGAFFAKPKKTGVTQLLVGYYLNKSTMTAQQQMGIMSKKGQDAVDTNMMFFFHAFDSLVSAFKPRVSNRAEATGMINFAEKAYRGNDLSKMKSGDGGFLNTKVMAVPTKPAAFDSPLIHDAWFDELPKTYKESKIEPKKIFDTNKEAVKIQSRFNGRVWISSYANEENDIGHEQTKNIYNESKLDTMQYGRTGSGLICHHIPAFNANIECIDKYGDCDQPKAIEITNRERNRLKKDKKAYNDALRQYSFDEKEYWGSSGFSVVFDTVGISEVKFELEKEIRESPIPLWEEGNLVWTNPMWEIGKKDKRPPKVFCPVRFVPLTEEEKLSGKSGKIRMFKGIPYDQQNYPLRIGIDEVGNLLPPSKFKYFSGVDGTQYADSDDVEDPSMQSSFVINMHDDKKNSMHRDIVTKVPIYEYNARPDLAEEAYQDVVKQIIFFGCLTVVEANAPHIYTRLKNEGLTNYMIVKHKEGYFCRWTNRLEDNEYTGVKRSKNQAQNELMETIIELIKHYTYRGDGFEMQYTRKIKSVELLDQFCNFKVEDTRKYDRVMSFGYCLLAYETYRAELSVPRVEELNDGAVRALFGALSR